MLIIWKYFGHFQTCQTKPNQFATLTTHLWGIGLSGIMQSDRTKASWKVTQELEFCQTWKLRCEVKCHNSSASRQFSRKSKALWDPFSPNMSKNEFCANYAISPLRWKSNKTSWKNQKKLVNWSWEKCSVDWKMEWGTLRQQWFFKTLCLLGHTRKLVHILPYEYITRLLFWNNFDMLTHDDNSRSGILADMEFGGGCQVSH